MSEQSKCPNCGARPLNEDDYGYADLTWICGTTISDEVGMDTTPQCLHAAGLRLANRELVSDHERVSRERDEAIQRANMLAENIETVAHIWSYATDHFPDLQKSIDEASFMAQPPVEAERERDAEHWRPMIHALLAGTFTAEQVDDWIDNGGVEAGNLGASDPAGSEAEDD